MAKRKRQSLNMSKVSKRKVNVDRSEDRKMNAVLDAFVAVLRPFKHEPKEKNQNHLP